jgi:hypothetical protein
MTKAGMEDQKGVKKRLEATRQLEPKRRAG